MMLNFNFLPLITFKPTTLLMLLLSMSLVNCGGSTSPSPSTNTLITPTTNGTNGAGSTGAGAAVPATLQGQWLRVDTGQKIWLGQQSNLSYTTISNDLLEVIDGSTKYHLIRAGISNVAVSGGIILTGVVVTPTKGLSTKAVAIPTVDLVNVNDPYVKATVQVDSYGQFTTSLPSGTYRVTSNASTGESVDAEVVVERDAIDLGAFNLKNATAPNFKSEVIDDEYFYFGTQLGQGTIDYTKTIRVNNLTSINATGMQVSISSTDPYIDTYSFVPQAAGVQAGGSMDVTFNFNFKRPPTDRTVHFNIDITYYDLALTQYVWRDSVSMQLSSHPPVKLYFDVPKIVQTGNQGANGYVITPGRTLKKINATNLAGDSMLVPYIAGQTYDIVFSNPAVTSETPYGIGIGVPTSNVAIQTFTNIPLNEPTDNTAALATSLSLSDRHISYLHQGDIDHYALNFDTINTPFNPSFVSSQEISAQIFTGSSGGETLINATANSSTIFALERDSLSNLHLRAYDLAGNPIVGGVLSLGTVYQGSAKMSTQGSFLYITSSSLYIIDTTNPSAMTLTTVSPIGATAHYTDSIVQDPYVFAMVDYNAQGSTKIDVLDISNPATPSLLGSSADLGFGLGTLPIFGGEGNILAVYKSMLGEVVGIDVSNKNTPIIGATLSGVPSAASLPIRISNQQVFIQIGSRLQVTNISDVLNPINLGTFDLPNANGRGFVSGNFTISGTTGYFILGSYTDSNSSTFNKSPGLQIVDLSNLNNIVSLGTAFDPVHDPNGFIASNINIIGNSAFIFRNTTLPGSTWPPSMIQLQLK